MMADNGRKESFLEKQLRFTKDFNAVVSIDSS